MKTTKLEKINACYSAVLFCKQFKTYKEAWEQCPRGDWMLWLASHLKVDQRLLTLAKGKCAATVLHLMKDQRSKDAVQATIDFGNNLISQEQLAAYAADAAAAYAADAAAAYAADAAAAYAADAAAAYADAAAAYAADAAAAYAADAAAAYADAAAAAYAAAAAAYAAAAAAYAADAAAADDAAAAYADAAAAYAYAADAKKANQLTTANICREILTETVYAKYRKL